MKDVIIIGRFLFSTSKKEYNIIKRNFVDFGFSLNEEVEGDSYWASTFNKLAKNTENFLRLDNGDFVASSGTLIYDIKNGIEALQLIYDRFEGNIGELRDGIIGNYAIIIKKNSLIYMCVDKYTVYKLYYFESETCLIVTNCLYRLAKAICDPIINTYNVIEESFQYSIIGNGTIFDNIKVLEGKEYLKYDILSGKTEKLLIDRKMRYVKKGMSIDEMAKELANLIHEKTKIIINNYGDVAINLTGGLDSRLILASFLSAGIKPKLIYGVGDTTLTNTKTRDLELNKIFSEKFKLEFYQMDWTTDKNFMKNWDTLLERYGHYYRIYGGNIKIFNEYEHISSESDFIQFGYFGELLRNMPWLENFPADHFSLDDFLNNYFYFNFPEILYPKDQFIEAIREKFLTIIKDLCIDPEKISKDDFVRIHANYRISADTVMVNFSNLLLNSVIILSIPDIFEYILQVPFEYKKDARFQLKVINYLYPEVLEVPFFSHCENQHFNQTEFKLSPMNNKPNRILRYSKNLFKCIPDGLFKKYLSVILVRFYINDPNYITLKSDFITNINILQQKLDLHLINLYLFTGSLSSLSILNQNLHLIKNAMHSVGDKSEIDSNGGVPGIG